jgi:hypothetical protein
MKLITTSVLLIASQVAFAQNNFLGGQDSIEKRLVFIGDAGDPGSIVNGKAVVIDAARRTIPMDKKTTVIFMGDNLYYNGLPCEEDICYKPGKRTLDTQATLVLNTDATAYFIPGNHDWAQGKADGYDNILRQGAYIDAMDPKRVQFYPKDGCPGPVEVPVGDNAVLVIMDSQWWLHRHQKPGVESDCPYKTKEEVLDELEDIIDRNSNKLVLFACHHPFRSTGTHSNHYGLKQHIFPLTDLKKSLYIPLPLIGSIYPISRQVFGSPQDLKFPSYANMINQVSGVLKKHPYVVFVGGHEHNMQFMKDSSYNYVVSGAGCKTQRVGHGKLTRYAAAKMGFAVIDILKNKSARITFVEVEPKTGETKLAYTENIVDFSKFPMLAPDTATRHDLVFQDSVTAPINTRYLQTNWFKRVILGMNYRKEWGTPVKLKVFRINKEMGGFVITDLKGGKQTRSLQLEDRNGKKWVLRSLNKNPEQAIPNNFRHSLAQDIVQDMISASDPYGALGVPPLAEALKIAHPKPKLYFVPDDYAMGKFRALFANTVCTLEELEPTYDGSEAKSSFKMFNKLIEEKNRSVDQKLFLKARMLDFLLADFDRHQGQWKWGRFDTGEKKYYPIPRDRDQAFFYSDGRLIKWASKRRLRFMKGFRYDIPDFNGLAFVARDMDRAYLNELEANDWQQTLAEFKAAMSDEVIQKSATSFPPEINALDSAVFAAKMKSRREIIAAKGMGYYKFISRKVIVHGTNNNEYFHIGKNDTGLRVTVWSRKDDGQLDEQLYARTFDPKVTKELALYGFNGNDAFKIDDNARSKIRVVIVGGLGDDTFNIRGKVHTYIYDFKKGNNVILSQSRTRNMFSARPEVNNYDEKFNYNELLYPRPRISYNIEDKLLVGGSIYSKTYSFRKEPYFTEQSLGVLVAPQSNAYRLNYNGTFNNVLNKLDLLVNGDFVHPTLNNFFGFGNETVNDKSKGFYFYRVRYKYATGSAQLRLRMAHDLVSLSFGPTYYHYWSQYGDNAGHVLARPSDAGLDSVSIYSQKSYAGGHLTININNLNDDLFPTRGVNWVTDFSSVAGLNDNSRGLTKLQSGMAIYGSLTDPATVVGMLRFGGAHIFSENFEYFQALNLGSNNFLRGFRKNRFSGSSLVFAGFESRIRLFDFRSYILPGEFGLIGFVDGGRVWTKDDNSWLLANWHGAYGGGIYFMPFNIAIISATMAFSKEEQLFNFTVGTKINVTF